MNRIATIWLLAIAGLLGACRSNVILAPEGTVPRRSQIGRDPYGGHIRLTLADNTFVEGELIGMRNDSVILLAGIPVSIPRNNVTEARVIVYTPSKNLGALIVFVPNILLLSVTGYGSGPAGLALYLSLIDAAGLTYLMGGENASRNYYDLTDGWNEVRKYARFPFEVPQSVNLRELKGREQNLRKKKR